MHRLEIKHPYLYEQLDILRRIAERGKSLAESTDYTYEPTEFIDLFVHLLDEIERTKINA